MKWAPNATSGTMVAGTGLVGNGNNQLNRPYGLYLDEINSHLYIADLNNHRIQRYTLGIISNGSTVAGGNGAGSRSNQLNSPYAVCLSKTGVIYIANSSNERIQRWSPGVIYGVTIAGIAGVIGTNKTLLSKPGNVALSLNETYLYVSEMNNHRVLRFKLIQ
jgi:sugar lactone lactonase YvrE